MWILFVFVLHGLIPAHAGKTHPKYQPRKRYRAHPRSRGENGSGAGVGLTVPGSSPLTRGKQLGGFRVDAGLRLIPAHAGKTARASM